MSITAQQAVFHDRVGRILSGQGVVTMGTVFVGDDTSFRPATRPGRGLALPLWLRQMLLFPACLAAGLASHLLLLLADWHLTGLVGVAITDAFALARQGALGLALVLVVTALVGLGDRSMLLAKALGLALAITAGHNLVHLAPQPFSRAFAPEWTAQVLARTAPQTLVLRGTVIPF